MYLKIWLGISVFLLASCAASEPAQTAPSGLTGQVQSCKRDNALALKALQDKKYGHVVILRHGVSPTTAYRAGDEKNCDEPNRHLRGNAQVQKLGVQLSAFNVTELHASTACRTQETAKALGLGLTHQPKKQLYTSSQTAAAFVETMNPKAGEVVVLVSHSHIIPGAVSHFGPALAQSVTETEAVVLRKEQGKYRCKASMLVGAGTP